ncbi:BEL1-like homeodomain protein 1 [Morella rubra]|uniref:BEL1-like homeodomain protein 1 n=1 Tax=Morella rubra TaxID=262757 RepID=A0A6A1VTM4_9ROSI|nr:BEL1-like homeodomain protein 1 [Morella rubra]
MGSYYHGGSEIQATADGLQTLYLMNPNYVPYADTQEQQRAANMLLLNSAGNGFNPASLSHMPPPNQHFVGIPLISTNNSGDSNRPSLLPPHEISGLHVIPPSRVHYSLWGPVDHAASATAASSSGGATDMSQMGFGGPTQQGLSLSLSSQRTAYRPLSGEHDTAAPVHVQGISPTSVDDLRTSGNSSSSVSAVSNGITGMQSVVLGSKYLKAAQELLDEVVNVGKGFKVDSGEVTKAKMKMKMKNESRSVVGDGAGESSTKQGAELTTAQRQELQMKKAKLVSMLDEVEQRYRQYYHHIQIVVSSFEQAAGLGSARSYTALALQTISKQFRSLKEAISSQIKATRKSMGEEDSLGAEVEGSRLRYVDQQLRQQRALQQLGMLQHNAWRPQRGLPERAVSVLRAWLFDHFLHPYPKDTDKTMLAKQTGLTRSQVSNWFINARVRLWKPMVEEMYSKEIKEQEQNASDHEDSANKPESNKASRITTMAPQQSSASEKYTNPNVSPTEISNSSMGISSQLGGSNIQTHSGFNLVGSSDVKRSPKKPRSSEAQDSPYKIMSMDMEMKSDETCGEMSNKFGSESQSKDAYLFIGGTESDGGGFGTYPRGDHFGRFNPEQSGPRFHVHGGGVSLSLGLPHCENLSLGGTPQSYFSHQNIQMGTRLEMGMTAGTETDFCASNGGPQSSHSNNGYEEIDIPNRKRFAGQFLPDFVA